MGIPQMLMRCDFIMARMIQKGFNVTIVERKSKTRAAAESKHTAKYSTATHSIHFDLIEFLTNN